MYSVTPPPPADGPETLHAVSFNAYSLCCFFPPRRDFPGMAPSIDLRFPFSLCYPMNLSEIEVRSGDVRPCPGFRTEFFKSSFHLPRCDGRTLRRLSKVSTPTSRLKVCSPGFFFFLHPGPLTLPPPLFPSGRFLERPVDRPGSCSSPQFRTSVRLRCPHMSQRTKVRSFL